MQNLPCLKNNKIIMFYVKNKIKIILKKKNDSIVKASPKAYIEIVPFIIGNTNKFSMRNLPCLKNHNAKQNHICTINNMTPL